MLDIQGKYNTAIEPTVTIEKIIKPVYNFKAAF